jgi:hypothetical protein
VDRIGRVDPLRRCAAGIAPRLPKLLSSVAGALATDRLRARSRPRAWGRRTSQAEALLERSALGEPARAAPAETLFRCRFVTAAVLRAQDVAPAAVRPFVNEGPGAALVEAPAVRRVLLRVRLHVVEAAVPDGRIESFLVEPDLEERRDPSYLTLEIALEVGEMQEEHVRQVPDRPPGGDAVPE